MIAGKGSALQITVTLIGQAVRQNPSTCCSTLKQNYHGRMAAGKHDFQTSYYYHCRRMLNPSQRSVEHNCYKRSGRKINISGVLVVAIRPQMVRNTGECTSLRCLGILLFEAKSFLKYIFLIGRDEWGCRTIYETLNDDCCA